MTSFHTIELDVEVTDPQDLWDTAKDYLIGAGIAGDDVASTIGLRIAPDVPACLAMLLDRSEHLGPGAEIQEHRFS